MLDLSEICKNESIVIKLKRVSAEMILLYYRIIGRRTNYSSVAIKAPKKKWPLILFGVMERNQGSRDC